jgi:hypothetical protein
MTRNERLQRLVRLVPLPMMLFAAACGGGGDKSPTGPTDPGPGQQDAVQFQLVSLGLAGLPADAQVEDCQLTRFYGGSIAINPKTGTWQIDLKVHDETGDWHARDKGSSEGNGTEVLFDSQSGGTYEGTVNGDATEIKIMYDWCENGVPDVQLVFDR